ncbi:MAG: AI-2E family transporter [Ignavibacteria bacterium]|jgi:predicted PurR-regulated permease PerM
MTPTEFIWKKTSKILLTLLIISFIIYVGYLFFDILVMLTISLLIAMIFNPLVRLLEQHGVHRLPAVFIVFIISGVSIFILLSLLIPKIISQMNVLASLFTQERIQAIFSQMEESVRQYVPFVHSTDLVSRISEFLSSALFSWINNFSNIISSIVSVVAIAIIVPFMTFFILKDSNMIIKGIINVMPNKYFEMSFWVIWKIKEQLGRFVRGWLIDATFVGVASAIGLSILGIQNSVTIGFVAGVGHLIPYFGPLIGGLPAIIISIIQFGDFSMLPGIIIMFVIIYTIDNGYVQPNVFSKSTDIHPLLIIILILVGSQLMGIVGMLLAVPVATVLRTAVIEIYRGYKNYKIIKVY